MLLAFFFSFKGMCSSCLIWKCQHFEEKPLLSSWFTWTLICRDNYKPFVDYNAKHCVTQNVLFVWAFNDPKWRHWLTNRFISNSSYWLRQEECLKTVVVLAVLSGDASWPEITHLTFKLVVNMQSKFPLFPVPGLPYISAHYSWGKNVFVICDQNIITFLF